MIRLLAEAGGVLGAAGVVLAVVALVGTARPARPPSRTRWWIGRVWRGDGLSARERRMRQSWLVASAGIGALTWLVTGMPVFGLTAAAALPGTPWLLAVGRAERRTIARIEAVGEWTRRLRDIATTGVGLQQAIVSSTHTAPLLIADEVGQLAARLQAGWNARTALLMFADDIADPVCDQVVAALLLHLTDRGERLGDVLGGIAGGASAEVTTRREVEAKRTTPRFAVKFLTVMTLLTLAYGAIRPEYMRPYATAQGQLVMALLSGAFIGLLLWTRSLSLPPQVPRLLAAPRGEETAR